MPVCQWAPVGPGVRQPPRGSRHGCVQTGNADRGEARGFGIGIPIAEVGFCHWVLQDARVLKLEAGRCPSGAHGRLHSRLQWPKSRLQPETAAIKETREGAGSQAPGVCQCAVFKFQGRFETKLARVASRARLSLFIVSLLQGNFKFRVLTKKRRTPAAPRSSCHCGHWHWRSAAGPLTTEWRRRPVGMGALSFKWVQPPGGGAGARSP